MLATMPPKSTSLRPVVEQRGDETAGAPEVDLGAVERFVMTVPSLRRLLALPAASDRELLLRAEMRRTIAALAATLDEAARGERRSARAAVYRVTAIVAADLATTSGAVNAPVTLDH